MYFLSLATIWIISEKDISYFHFSVPYGYFQWCSLDVWIFSFRMSAPHCESWASLSKKKGGAMGWGSITEGSKCWPVRWPWMNKHFFYLPTKIKGTSPTDNCTCTGWMLSPNVSHIYSNLLFVFSFCDSVGRQARTLLLLGQKCSRHIKSDFALFGKFVRALVCVYDRWFRCE